VAPWETFALGGSAIADRQPVAIIQRFHAAGNSGGPA